MDAPELNDMFEPFDDLIDVDVCGQIRKLPENNSILRGFQFLNAEEMSYGDFCWNGECLNCQVWIEAGDKQKAVMACRTNVAPGMRIVKMTDEMRSSLEG